MSDKKEKVSLSLIAGELRKGARLYEVFKNASEAADVLANYERETSRVKKDQADAEEMLSALTAKCEDVYKKQTEVEQKTQDLIKDSVNKSKEAQSDAKRIIFDAKEKAESIVVLARHEADQITSEMSASKAALASLKSDEQEALNKLSKLNNKIESAKKSFLRALD